jgi:V8-like Glu-specific endopeptidase
MAAEPAELARQARSGDALGDRVGQPERGRAAARRARRARGRRRKRRWCTGLLALAAGISLPAVGIIATPLNDHLDTLAAGAQAMSPASGLQPAPDAQAAVFSGTPAVGALFLGTAGGGLGRHFCSASVVDSPAKDLLVTAAHCVSGDSSGPVVFIPGYDDGRIPYGIWQITRIIVSQNWVSSADPDDDVAFLVTSAPGGQKIQDVTGGERLGIGLRPGLAVSVVGYPDGSNAPVRCDNLAREFSPTQLEFDCGGYTDGTSGGPLLEDVSPSTGLGTVIGVIGGYEEGGYTPSVSYAARFGADVDDLYRTAIGQQ